MNIAIKRDRQWTADEFVVTDQHAFGPLWRYELVDGRVIGHAVPTPERAAILAGLAIAVGRV